MKTTKEIGNLGESLAEEYLKEKGWKILSTNYCAKGGEIDIIGYKRKQLVFFEVKTRSSENYGTPAQAVDRRKINCIRAAASDFLWNYCGPCGLSAFTRMGRKTFKPVKEKRIDVIEVYLPDKKINHIKNIYNGEENELH